MAGYAKLFTSILHSTIWLQPDHVRLVWITMLAMANRSGVIEASVPGLAVAARVTLDQCQEALDVLMAPDPYSRSTEHDGRRVEICDGKFILLTWEKHRSASSTRDKKDNAAARMARYRAKKRATKSEQKAESERVDACYAKVDPSCNTTINKRYASGSGSGVCFCSSSKTDPELPDRSGSGSSSGLGSAAPADGQSLAPSADAADGSGPSCKERAGRQEDGLEPTLGGTVAVSSSETLSGAASESDASELDATHSDVLQPTVADIAAMYLHDPTAARLLQQPPEEWEVVGQVLAAWGEVWGSHPPLRGGLRDPRLEAILTRLSEGYTVEQLACAVAGAKNDEFIARKKNLQTIATILKDGNAVDKYSSLVEGAEVADESDFEGDEMALRHHRAKQGAEGPEAQRMAKAEQSPLRWWMAWTEQGTTNDP